MPRHVPLVALLAPTAAAAQESVAQRVTARLEYHPDADACPDERALRQEVAARLGYDPFAPDARAVVRASITRETPRLVARVTTLDAIGSSLGMLTRRETSAGLGVGLASSATLALYGVWRLARRDPIERAWSHYERARTPVIVPLATPAPSGATLGVAVTW